MMAVLMTVDFVHMSIRVSPDQGSGYQEQHQQDGYGDRNWQVLLGVAEDANDTAAVMGGDPGNQTIAKCPPGGYGYYVLAKWKPQCSGSHKES